MGNWFSLLNGPQTMGNGRGFWVSFCAVILILVALPLFADSYLINNIGFFFVWVFMSMGLSLLWGYTGILSFGQTAFFGVAGYAYGVITLNFGSSYGLTFAALLVAVALAALVALIIGYFMFYGGIRDVFVGIVTLSITLVFETFMAQTAGPEWAIGSARLNGFNGMSGMPPLTIPWPGQEDIALEGQYLFWFLVALVVCVYLGLRILVNSRFGNVMVAIRENPNRAEMLGYDVRRYQLIVFVIAGALAGLSGVLYTTWGTYITPSTMGLTAAALPIVWTAAGGRKDLTATLVATIFLVWLSQILAVKGSQYALILMGFILLVAVMLAPEGFVVTLVKKIGLLARRSAPKATSVSERKLADSSSSS
ncbi:MAG: ABC transporter permease [Burkholderiales bacterium]